MKVQIYATKPDGYWWKAPSWDNGRQFTLEQGVELELDDADMAALDEHVKGGYWLRYIQEQAPKAEPKAPPPPEKKK